MFLKYASIQMKNNHRVLFLFLQTYQKFGYIFKSFDKVSQNATKFEYIIKVHEINSYINHICGIAYTFLTIYIKI